MLITLQQKVLQFLDSPPHQKNPHHDELDWLIHPSYAMQCSRKIYYTMNMPGESGSSMPLIAGIMLHQYICVNIATLFPGTQANVKIDLRPKYPVIGEADLVDENEVLDLKTTSENGLYFRKHEKQAALPHRIQTAIYAIALAKPLFGIFYLSRSLTGRSLNYSEYFQYNTEDYIDQVANELVRLTEIRGRTELPNRRAWDGTRLDPDNNWECAYCGFRQKCIAAGEITRQLRVIK